MARNLSPRTKRMRRIGEKLFTHGEKAFSRRPYPPGMHGPKGTSKVSEYGVRLREKQKAQLTYGLLERQFRRYVERARRRRGDTGAVLMQMLELRLDNVVYRSGLAPSREAARQLVRHGHVTVDAHRVTIPSFSVRIGQTVAIHPGSRKRTGLSDLPKRLENARPPAWMRVDGPAWSANVTQTPSVEEASSVINPQRIVEFYSR